jgi:hypothetical protein
MALSEHYIISVSRKQTSAGGFTISLFHFFTTSPSSLFTRTFLCYNRHEEQLSIHRYSNSGIKAKEPFRRTLLKNPRNGRRYHHAEICQRKTLLFSIINTLVLACPPMSTLSYITYCRRWPSAASLPLIRQTPKNIAKNADKMHVVEAAVFSVKMSISCHLLSPVSSYSFVPCWGYLRVGFTRAERESKLTSTTTPFTSSSDFRSCTWSSYGTDQQWQARHHSW